MDKDQLREELRTAGDEFKATRLTHATAREVVVDRLVTALRNGIGVVEAAALSGYTRENVRLLARKHDIDP